MENALSLLSGGQLAMLVLTAVCGWRELTAISSKSREISQLREENIWYRQRSLEAERWALVREWAT